MTTSPSPEYRVHPDNPGRIAARGCRTVGNPTFWIDLSAPGWRLTDEDVEGWTRLVPAPPVVDSTTHCLGCGNAFADADHLCMPSACQWEGMEVSRG